MKKKKKRRHGKDEIDFKRDIAERCVRAVKKSNSEEEQRMFGLAVIESFVRSQSSVQDIFETVPRLVRETTRGVCDTNALPWLVGAAK